MPSNLFEAEFSRVTAGGASRLFRFVARFAPVAASEVMESGLQRRYVQSLIDRRLTTSWRATRYLLDIFATLFITGRVPIEDSYILRQSPRAVARLLAAVAERGGDASVPEVGDCPQKKRELNIQPRSASFD